MANELNEFLDRLAQQNAALQSICACLISEVALANPNPAEKLEQIITGLQRLSAGSAIIADGELDTTHMSDTIEHLCGMAEAVFAEQIRPRDEDEEEPVGPPFIS